MTQATTWDNTLWEAGLFIGEDYPNCHMGDTKTLSLGRRDGGSLYIGGRSRSTTLVPGVPVFDLTGHSQPQGHKSRYYSLGIPAYGVPKWSMYFWEQIAQTLYYELAQGDVYIISQNAHGRLATFTSVLAYLLKSKRYMQVPQAEMLSNDPVKWIEAIHCSDSMDSIMQNIYVYEICNQFSPNTSITMRLAELEIADPRYIFYPDIEDMSDEEMYESLDPEEFTCPMCLIEYDTLIEAIACHSSSLTQCPLCDREHELPVEAYQCCHN